MLTQDELKAPNVRWMNKNRCEHGVTFIEHQACYRTKKYGKEQRIGFIDIEASGLKADYDIMYSYCILNELNNEVESDVIMKSDFGFKNNHKADTRIVKKLICDMKKFDYLVGHYSSRYDLKFIRTRAVMDGLGNEFPRQGEICQYDTINVLWSKFCLSKNGLQPSCNKLVGRSRKTYLTQDMRFSIILGLKWAQEMCLDHNLKDVYDTRDLYKVISPFMRKTKTSI